MRVVLDAPHRPRGCRRAPASRLRALERLPCGRRRGGCGPPRRSARRPSRRGSARSSAPGRSSRCRCRGSSSISAVARAVRGRGRRTGSGCPSTDLARAPRSRRMIESAVTDFPLPDSPTTPSVRPVRDLEVDAVDGPDRPALRGNQVRRFSTRSSAQASSGRRLAVPGVRSVMWRSSVAIRRSRSRDWNAASSSPCSTAIRSRSASRPKRKK